MTSKFESDEQLTRHVTEVLDDANAQLPDSVASQLQQRRHAALRQAGSESSQSATSGFAGMSGKQVWLPALAAGFAVVAILRYDGQVEVPVLPDAMLVAEVPSEDLAMLEELEFAHWLAEQEDEVAL